MHESADKPAHLTWFERLYSIATTLEKSLLYPFIFVTGLTFTQAELLNKWGIYFAVLLQAVAGLKLFRQSFGIVISQFLLLTYCEILIELFLIVLKGDMSLQYVILTFTLLFFNYDFRYSESFVIDYFVMLFVVAKVSNSLALFDT